MRQRNKLYTVNRFNKPAFVDRTYQNIFDGFGQTSLAVTNPLSFKQAFSGAGLKAGLNAGLASAVTGVANAVGGVAGNAIAGGLESGAGSAISNIGSTVGSAVGAVNPLLGAAVGVGSQLVGGLVNRAFGTKENTALKREVEAGINQNNNFVSTASSFDDIKGPQAVMTNTDVYSGGWFSGGKARRKNEELKRRMIAAKDWANRSVDNNVFNLVDDQNNDALANFAAYGGSLDFGTGALGLMQQNRYFDTIDKRSEAIAGKGQTMQTEFTGGAKTFADGGLKSAFLDEFGSDPIGAAVRYNQGLEALAAQEEANKIEAERESEYLAMQKRLADLETTQQGLQALVTAQRQNEYPLTPDEAYMSEASASSSSPSRAAYNSNWDYIEDQLKRSGKFNDVQIKGIKYNLQRESSIDPTVVGDGGAAFGLGQWHGSRKPKDMSLEGQTKHLIDTISNFDGKEHWIRKRDYEGFLNARTPEEAHYYLAKGYERPRADIVAKVKRDSDMSLKRLNAFGGELGTNGTDFTNGLLYIDEGGSHESNPLDGVPMGLDPEGIPNLVEEGETVYDDYVFSDRMNVPDFMLKDLGLPKSKKGISFADASKKLAQESEKRPNDPISKDGLQASLSRLAEIQETERMKKQAEEYMGLEGYACGGKLGHKYKLGSGLHSRKVINNSSDRNYDGVHADKITWNFDPHEDEVKEQMGFGNTHPITEAARQAIAMEGYIPEYNGESADAVDFLTNGIDSRLAKENGPKTYDTWMRYAPAVGSGIMALTDALGLTNKPDYTYADKIAGYAERVGVAPQVSYKPIGNYLTYRPMDIWFEQNRMDANARATDRAILNNAAPVGTKMAGLLASGYNNQIANGQLYRNALEYNDAKRERVADFNRKTNMFNSQMGLEAAMANARYTQAARQMGLSGLAQAAALRDSIDARVGASRSTNLSNFLTSLGNIGRENFAINQINTDRSRNYTTTASGKQGYKRKKK